MKLIFIEFCNELESTLYINSGVSNLFNSIEYIKPLTGNFDETLITKLSESFEVIIVPFVLSKDVVNLIDSS
jgi:hypothetical protein